MGWVCTVGFWLPLDSGGLRLVRVTLCVMWALFKAERVLVPPSSLLRLNPSVSIPKEGDNLRSPFQAIVPCDLAMLPRQLFAWRNLLV